MNLQASLAWCAAVHTGALMFCFGTLALRRVPGLALELADARAGLPARRVVGAGELRWAVALALASAALWPLLQTGVARDDAGAALDPTQIALVMGQTTFGRIWLWREALVAGALVLAWTRSRIGHLALWLLLGGALASMALLGHAAGVAGAAGWGQKGVLALHLLAAGAWLGALPSLWLCARRMSGDQLAPALRRFSAWGLGCVLLVVLSGTLSAWWRIGSAAALVDSGYGRLLLGKVALVALMGVSALLNRNRFTPALQVRASIAPEPARHALVASIGAETLLGTAVVVLAFFLGAADAPR
jgi:putative copper resistance protein D